LETELVIHPHHLTDRKQLSSHDICAPEPLKNSFRTNFLLEELAPYTLLILGLLPHRLAPYFPHFFYAHYAEMNLLDNT